MDYCQLPQSESDVSALRSHDNNLEPTLSATENDVSVGPSGQLSQSIDNSDSLQEQPGRILLPPPDKYNLFYAVSYLLGTSTLLPWYFFITCTEYWKYRFRQLPNSTIALSYNSWWFVSAKKDVSDQLQTDFMSYFSIASTIPSAVVLIASLLVLKRFSIHGRVVLSFTILLLLFVETTVLILFNTDKWQWYFFIVTLATVIVLNISTGLLQAALCAIITRFPVRYISAFSSGQSVAGILAAISRILSLYVGVDRIRSTFIYFTFADVIVLMAFLSYFVARKTEFYKFYNSQSSENRYYRLSTNRSPVSSAVNYRDLQERIAYPSLSLFLCFVVTTCVYPSIAALVISSNYPIVSLLDNFFVPVITYLLYSVCEYSGRILAGLIQKPEGRYTFWLGVSRVILVPLIMLCNAQPRAHLPVLVTSDLIYAAIVIVLALTNGYLTNLSFVLMHRYVYYNEHEAASSILVIWLALGLSVGSLISFPLVNML